MRVIQKSRTGIARNLRRQTTDAERLVWQHLRDRRLGGFKFRRQHPIGRYIADFVGLECRLVVELDGSQHIVNRTADARRTRDLAQAGYRVLRFWDNDVLRNTDAVLAAILAAADSPHPCPLPRGERAQEGGGGERDRGAVLPFPRAVEGRGEGVTGKRRHEASGFRRRASGFAVLAAQMSRCRKCGLPKGVSAVFGRFDTPRWMLVGQAPGKKEVALGRPFAGSAGRRLFQWLAEAGFEEQQFRSFCYVTAMMKCFPGSGQRGDLRPSRQQLANCAAWLEQELTLVRPDVLIPVGQLAIERFLGKARLDELIGRRFRRSIAGCTLSVIPLPHPSGASAWTNARENRRLIRRAIGMIRRAASGR